MAGALTKNELRTLKAISEPSDQKGLAHVAGHLAAIGATTTLIGVLQDRGWWLLPALLPQAVLLIFLFAPEHECIHGTAFRSRWLNHVVAWLAGLVLILPPAYFRAFHLAHHRYTQDPERDPELVRPKPQSWGGFLLHVSGLIYWHDALTRLFRHGCGRVNETFVPARDRAIVIAEARIFLGVYAAIAVVSLLASSGAAVIYWLGPMVLGQPFLRLYLLCEHSGCPFIPDMLKNTRTTITTSAMRLLAWNMPYHTEHHVYPAIPFHALPSAHKLIRHRLTVVDQGYAAVIGRLLRTLQSAGSAVEQRPR